MLTLILCLVAPLAAAPLLVYGSRYLFAIFVRESADLFLGMEMHKAWAITVGTDIAILNVLIFSLAWWAAVGMSALSVSSFLIAAPFLLAIALAMLFTSMMLKAKLKLEPRDACMVGLLTCAGGNLPLIIIIPALLMIVMSQQALVVIE